MANANLKAVPSASPYSNTGNLLVDMGGTLHDALHNMKSYGDFLTNYIVNEAESPSEAGDSIVHGHFLAMTILTDAIRTLRDIENQKCEGGNHD